MERQSIAVYFRFKAEGRLAGVDVIKYFAGHYDIAEPPFDVIEDLDELSITYQFENGPVVAIKDWMIDDLMAAARRRQGRYEWYEPKLNRIKNLAIFNSARIVTITLKA